MIKITHLAHAGFLIENEIERLIIDPSDANKGYEFKEEKVNYLLISHKHPDHINTQTITVGENVGTFQIYTIESAHDKEDGALRGKNTIHVIETKGVKICHLGDLGHVLTKEQVAQIGLVDVLLIPIGGFFTIDYKDAIEIVYQLNPGLVIPMHYKTKYWGEKIGIDSPENFVSKLTGFQVQVLDNDTSINYEKKAEMQE